ncbi:unnamed protein product [Ceutorhynchus assimilis]|uniref:SAP domain-containing protein n=1 Tax=Ceutorhynchus assimilis TaxID=467358 RepID=A0A9N9QQH7_9CUCU|nr:unnamed protein product [Ceutorhynchus assimilis]
MASPDVSLQLLSPLDIAKLKVPELKKELKSRGLSSTGNKTDLIERLSRAVCTSEKITTDSIDDIEEDLLNDDDDEQESITAEDFEESALDDLPKTPKTPPKRKIDDDDDEEKAGPPKKIILKRPTIEKSKICVEDPVQDKKVGQDDVVTEEKSSEDNNNDKKIIKISELTVKDRLEMRAKKFGVTNLSTEAKKSARAERFGGKETSVNSASSIKLNNPTPTLDLLNQRAARFGIPIATEKEKEEKLIKRKERFGLASTATANGASVGSEQAKAARLERFKTTIK